MWKWNFVPSELSKMIMDYGYGLDSIIHIIGGVFK